MRTPSAATPYIALLVLSAASAGAQSDRSSRFLDNCRNNSRQNNEQFCELRDFTVNAGRTLTVNGRQNGGITVHGWDRPETRIVAMVQAQAASEAEAAVIAKAVSIGATGGDVAAAGPDTQGYRESWSVSYEIWTPRGTDLTLTANNGGLAVDNVTSKMSLETTNGGLSLVDVAGDVHASTTNGGITAELSGDRWSGAGLDARTSNGGVRITLPANYSARLEAGTVNGALNVGVPVASRESRGRSVSTTLGGGGALIHASTTNGGVTLVRR